MKRFWNDSESGNRTVCNADLSTTGKKHETRWLSRGAAAESAMHRNKIQFADSAG
jgi:hypothetical protein